MTSSRRSWPVWVPVAILATVVATNAFDYSILVPQQSLRYETHDAIVTGTAPLAQRLHLVPYLMEPIVRGLSAAMPRDVAFRRAYFAFYAVALIALLGSVYAYARLWFTRDQALIGALVVGSVLRLALRQGEYWDFTPIPPDAVFTPWRLLDPIVIALGLRALYRGRRGTVAVMLLIGACNSWIAMLLSLGASRPSIADNIAHLPVLGSNLLLFFGPAALLVIAGAKAAPPFARRAAAAGAAIVIVLALTGRWWDLHSAAMLYPLITPLALAAIFRRDLRYGESACQA